MEFTDEQQAFIDAAMKEAVKGLKTKNSDLLTKLKDTTSKLNGFDGVDLKQMVKDSKELAKLKKTQDEKDNNYKKLYDQQTAQHQTEKEKLQQERDTALKTAATLRKTTSLQKALVGSHVDPVLMEAAETLLLKDVNLTDDLEAMVGDKPVTDYVKEWATTEVGKRFVSSGHSGGGASGSRSKGGDSVGKYFDRESKDYNITEQAKIRKQNPALYDKLAERHKKKA